jgi:hypothetical protein
MLVLLVPVIAIVALFRFLGGETPPTIDTASAYGAAERAHLFDVVTPTGLDEGWHIVSATYESGTMPVVTLRIGIVSPDGGALQLAESNAPAETFVPAQIGAQARAEGSVEVNGATWQRYVGGRPGERALVLATPGRTITIAGKADDSDLRTLAGSLR